ncbi:hypothetical protein [Methylocystis sp. JR02]|uniref:hypothetical protein n=1 Tax=Methylocystis sp. JR02 TaxID=3046284 RepID=UPI0024BA1F12|nr:hypothetical protein [Methylocystis sp. JR02]MDJ0447108.1 hypothetical protein [Methylocystis sp. JR02]
MRLHRAVRREEARPFASFADEQKANGFEEATVSRHETLDGEHGRIEMRRYTAFHDIGWLKERRDWPGLEGVVMVESRREIDGESTQERGSTLPR